MTTTFLKEFFFGLWVALPVLLSLALIISALGQVVGKIEGWSPFDSFYWAFITATTVGYGDVRPERRWSRILSILTALVGLTFTGILVAVAIHAGNIALAAYDVAMKAH